MHTFIAHPHHEFRLGDFLVQGFKDPKWTCFRAAIAFVKKSGTELIANDLAQFAMTRSTIISVGLDHAGSSVEGFDQLLSSISPNGQLWVYKNNANTFHPKVYLFRNASHADIVVGSGNLTRGGLYTNAEAGIRICLDLGLPADLKFLTDVEHSLDIWSTTTEGLCLPVDSAMVSLLHDSGELPNEKEAAEAMQKQKTAVKTLATAQSPFKHVGVKNGPILPKKVAVGTAINTGATNVGKIAPNSASLSFGMTLQNTDVGKGQTTKGTQKRSPEIFIPVKAIDINPTFWGWVNSQQADLTKYAVDADWPLEPGNSAWRAKELAKSAPSTRPIDKLDWKHVKVKLNGNPALLDVAFYFNPIKKDLRMREAGLRSAGKVGDILMVRLAAPGAAFSYEMEIIPSGTPRYISTLSKLTTKVNAPSKKVFGYI